MTPDPGEPTNQVPPAAGAITVTTATAREPVGLDHRRLLISTLITLGIVLLVTAVAGWLLYDVLVDVGEWFVARMGAPGVFVAFLVTDAMGIPVPPDTFAMFALTGGMAFATIVAWGGTGSICGGTVGYFVGRAIGRTDRVDRLTHDNRDQIAALVQRYGALAIAIAALTPLPYPFAAWAAGASEMRLRTFLLVSLLRIPRVAAYLFLIEMGLLSLRMW